MDLKGIQVIVLGAGSSGQAAAKLACLHGADVVLHDSAEIIKSELENVTLHAGATVDTGAGSSCDLLIVSPGIDTTADFAQAYIENAEETIGELEFASRFYEGKLIAITGTNGKTTTTELIDNILNHAGISCVPCGNYGLPLSDVVMMADQPEAVALEVSSFQLETIREFHPEVVVWLNFSADHMDRYPSLDAYKGAKLRVFENITSQDVIVVRAGEDIGSHDAQDITFSTETEADIIIEGQIVTYSGEQVLDLSETRLRGLHNAENAMAAFAVCSVLGVSNKQVVEALSDYTPPAHRCELVKSVNGVEYINDSKATNLHALSSALRALSNPIVLIAGGKDKGLDYAEVVPHLEESAKAVIVFGEIKNQLYKTFSATSEQVKVTAVDSLEQAVEQAQLEAESGDIVLFSPGTSSFDMFAGYEQRGDSFRELVTHLN